MSEPHDGRAPVTHPGFSYLPRFIEEHEAEALIALFAALTPIWEQRHAEGSSERSAGHARRLTRPVYWLGAWQFATLGYYAEPDHREGRCLTGEPLPPVMQGILDRLLPVLESAHAEAQPEGLGLLPNTCLVNYYGRETGPGMPRDYARLRMHRDGEPGPVIMFNIGQAGLLEFLDPDRSPDPELALWTRHRSVTILSGPEFKDRLYHRVTQVRTGDQPALSCRVERFQVRRISVSFRHVPDALIQDLKDLPTASVERVIEYVRELARGSAHYAAQLAGAHPAEVSPAQTGR